MSDLTTKAGRSRREIRRFDAAWRLTVVRASFDPNVTVAAVAREHGIRPNLLSYWRKRYGAMAQEHSATAEPPATQRFARVRVSDAPRSAAWLEIDIARGALRLIGPVSSAQLRQVLTAVRGAG